LGGHSGGGAVIQKNLRKKGGLTTSIGLGRRRSEGVSPRNGGGKRTKPGRRTSAYSELNYSWLPGEGGEGGGGGRKGRRERTWEKMGEGRGVKGG